MTDQQQEDSGQVRLERSGEVLLLHFSGRLDVLSSGLLEQQVTSLIRQGEKCVLLDFSEVSYLSSAGMRLLLLIYKLLKQSSGDMAVCSVRDGVMEVLRLSGIDGLLSVYPTQEEALRRLTQTKPADSVGDP